MSWKKGLLPFVLGSCLASITTASSADWPYLTDMKLWVEDESPSDSEHWLTVFASWQDEEPLGPYTGSDGVQGWSWGLCIDPLWVLAPCSEFFSFDRCDFGECKMLKCPNDILYVGPEGEIPDFVWVNAYPEGVVQGVVLSLLVSWSLPSESAFRMLQIRYGCFGATPTATVEFCTTLGSPMIPNVLVSHGLSLIPETQGLTLNCPAFIRGDANASGAVDIADAIYILQNLFANGPSISCHDAADSNDDNNVDIADAIYLLQHLFAQGPPIPAPYPECGYEETDDLFCVSFPPCE